MSILSLIEKQCNKQKKIQALENMENFYSLKKINKYPYN